MGNCSCMGVQMSNISNNEPQNSEKDSPSFSDDELNAIDEELAEVEDGLQVARRPGGQAAFNSVSEALGNIRTRLDHVPSDDTPDQRRGSMLRSLSERLRTADRAHSSRVPLRLLQRSNAGQIRRSSILSRVNSSRSKSESTLKSSAVGDDEQQSGPAAVGQRRLLFSQERRPSYLVASRARADQVEGFEVQLDVHDLASTCGLLSPVVESDRKSSLSEDDRKESNLSDMVIDEPETPVLITNSCRNKFNLSSTYLPGSVRLPPKSNTAVYSWGLGPHSLHNDTDDKTVEEARLSSDSRINRVTVLSVATSETHTACATAQGEVLTCGLNIEGCVDPDRRDQDIIGRPALLESLGQNQIVQVSCGYDHTAALSSNGIVLTWGGNKQGQLGHRLPFVSAEVATSFCRPKGMFLTGGRRVAAVSCGRHYTLVLTTRMSVLCCGSGLGEITSSGDNSTSQRVLKPIPALEGLPLVGITAGDRHAVVLTSFGNAFAFGDNKSGCCGRPFPYDLTVPVPFHVPETENALPTGPNPFPNWAQWDNQVLSISDDVAIVNAACGDDHTVLVTRSGRLLVCGSNEKGQLGLDSSKASISPVEAVNHPEHGFGRRFVTAEAGCGQTILLDDAGDVWQMGAMGNTEWRSPQRVLKGRSLLTVAAGGKQSIAVASGKDAQRRRFSVAADAISIDGNMLVESLEGLHQAVLKEQEGPDNVEQEQLTNSGQELVKRTEELLKYPAVLNSLFLDQDHFDQMYDKLLSVGDSKLQQCVATGIEQGMKIGLEKLRSKNSRMMYPEAVRCLLLYIKFFDRESNDSEVVFDSMGDCILAFCETMLGLPFEGYKALLTWATTIYPGDLFAKMLVRPLVFQLNKALEVHVDDNGVEHQSRARRAVPVIVSVLKWLQKASEKAGGLAKPEDFESEGFSKMDSYILYEDLARLKKANKQQRSSHFFLCANPFLFSPGCKRSLLQVESQVEMVKTATRDVTFDSEQEEYTIEPYFVLEIEREHLLEQTLEKIKAAEAKELRKGLKVVFKGEEGVDAGGVTREFFQLLSEELFDINSGLWSNRFGDHVTWFNSDCTWDDEGYELVGVLLGLAVYNSVLLDVHFPIAVYRKILGLPLGIEDMVDEELKRGLQQLLDYEGDDTEYVFCLNFEVGWTDLGEEQKIELKPGGSNIPVTSDNREEYVLLYVEWLLVDSIQPQWDAFERGLMRIMESSSLDLFRPEELQMLVVGTPELDFDALEANTEYEGGFDKDSDVVRNFWRFIKEADHDTQIKFLKFATASTKAPIGGLGKLPFKIQRAGPDSPQLPTSHTCFNTLLIPDYGSDYEKFSERLSRAIVECEGFGLQ